MKCRLAVISSHPIQYNAPAFAKLASDPSLDVQVFYGWTGPATTTDFEFGIPIEWDIPLTTGYSHTFVKNVSSDPGTHHFGGIDNPEMIERVSEMRPDVILIYGWNYKTHLRVLRHFDKKIPIIFRGDSTLLGNYSRSRKLLRKVFLRWVYGHVNVALYAGTRNQEYFHEMGMREEQLVWAPHAVDNERFSKDERQQKAEALDWRNSLGFADNSFVFVFVGKLVPRKNPMILLEAFIDLVDVDRNNARLLFVGEGELRQKLMNRAAGRSDIIFLGFQNQRVMPRVYRLGNALVMPSAYGETWGLSVNEAMACAMPAVVSDQVGCAIDLVVPGTTGFIVPNNDKNELLRVMRGLTNDPSSAEQMGEAAQALVRAWSIDCYVAAVKNTAMSLVG